MELRIHARRKSLGLPFFPLKSYEEQNENRTFSSSLLKDKVTVSDEAKERYALSRQKELTSQEPSKVQSVSSSTTSATAKTEEFDPDHRPDTSAIKRVDADSKKIAHIQKEIQEIQQLLQKAKEELQRAESEDQLGHAQTHSSEEIPETASSPQVKASRESVNLLANRLSLLQEELRKNLMKQNGKGREYLGGHFVGGVSAYSSGVHHLFSPSDEMTTTGEQKNSSAG